MWGDRCLLLSTSRQQFNTRDVEGGQKDENPATKFLTFLCAMLKTDTLGPTVPRTHSPCNLLSALAVSLPAPTQMLGTWRLRPQLSAHRDNSCSAEEVVVRDRCDCVPRRWWPHQPQTGTASHRDTHKSHRIPQSCQRDPVSPAPTWANPQFQHQAPAVWEKVGYEWTVPRDNPSSVAGYLPILESSQNGLFHSLCRLGRQLLQCAKMPYFLFYSPAGKTDQLFYS